MTAMASSGGHIAVFLALVLVFSGTEAKFLSNNITVVGSVYCDACSNVFSKHSFFLKADLDMRTPEESIAAADRVVGTPTPEEQNQRLALAFALNAAASTAADRRMECLAEEKEALRREVLEEVEKRRRAEASAAEAKEALASETARLRAELQASKDAEARHAKENEELRQRARDLESFVVANLGEATQRALPGGRAHHGPEWRVQALRAGRRRTASSAGRATTSGHSTCRATLVRSSSAACNVPGLRGSTQHIALRSRASNACFLNLNALNFRPAKRDGTLCHDDGGGGAFASSLFFWPFLPLFWQPFQFPFPVPDWLVPFLRPPFLPFPLYQQEPRSSAPPPPFYRFPPSQEVAPSRP
ncbi:hypothetical protein GUJ93_ZPchr0002g24776 [Zizania palustris]|uniref:Uncharacterized protein n=1 Tax=Zizania palustris TaxID=103762 RepID=A0A8J5VA93_ZIZPA|nr:hypothetical protein GUJ93_ZPchr0002g24776 [Zizania palustris]